MKTDAQLQADVADELQWDPAIHAAHVGVVAKAGVVSLTGYLQTYAERVAIERAVQRVEGVKAVAVTLEVKLAPGHHRSDAEIAEAAESIFRWNVSIPDDRIRVKVDKGRVLLSGEVDWDFQRRSAEKAVHALTGVVAVRNHITLKPLLTPASISRRIRDALTRHAERGARNIEVTVHGTTVTLRGRVDSWDQRAAVQGAAWSAPGISHVVNELAVGH